MPNVVALAEVRGLDTLGEIVLYSFDAFGPADEDANRVHLRLLGHGLPVGLLSSVELVLLHHPPREVVEVVDSLVFEPVDEERESRPVGLDGGR